MKQSKKKLAEVISSQSRKNETQSKSGIMKNLEYMLQHSNNSSSSFHTNEMSYLHKTTIKDYAREAIAKVKYYRQKSNSLFQIQSTKYQGYYRQIFDVIYEHYKQGKHKIQFQAKKVMKMFEEWKQRIQLHAQQIELKCYDYEYDEKIKLLQRYTRIEVDAIEIKLPELGSFKKAIEKYLLCPKQFNKQNKQDEETFTTYLKKQQKAQSSHRQRNNEASPKNPQKPLQQKSSNIPQEPDEILGCDEQLGAKASLDTIRRRKYDVGRQNVIKEEDESDDTNSVISDC